MANAFRSFSWHTTEKSIFDAAKIKITECQKSRQAPPYFWEKAVWFEDEHLYGFWVPWKKERTYNAGYSYFVSKTGDLTESLGNSLEWFVIGHPSSRASCVLKRAQDKAAALRKEAPEGSHKTDGNKTLMERRKRKAESFEAHTVLAARGDNECERSRSRKALIASAEISSQSSLGAERASIRGSASASSDGPAIRRRRLEWFGMRMHEQYMATDGIVEREFSKQYVTEDFVCGQGAYGTVTKATHLGTSQDVAVKTMSGSKKHVAAREIAALEVLDHPNIIRLLNVFASVQQVRMVIEFWGHDLAHRIRSEPSLTADQTCAYTRQLCLALAYIHGVGLCHNDLKPPNILEHGDVLKICDFGSAFQIRNRVRESSVTVEKHGLCQQTLWYRAPEVLLGDVDYGAPADIWSMAVVVLHMCLAQCPFRPSGQFDAIRLIFQTLGTPSESDWPRRFSLPLNTSSRFPNFAQRSIQEAFPQLSPVLQNFISSILVCNPDTRLQATEALTHEYFQPALPVIQLHGKSSSSVVPFCLRQCVLSGASLAALTLACNSFAAEAPQSCWISRDGGTGRELPFRTHPGVAMKTCQGTNFRLLASASMTQLHSEIVSSLQSFLDEVREKARDISYKHGKRVRPAVCEGRDGFFGSYGVLKDYPSGVASCEYHCDGGPSAIFMALTVSGERCLEVEAVNPTTGAVEKRIPIFCKPGHVYVSSPACFWHRVRPVSSPPPGPQRTLILRSQCLEMRHSGGMTKVDGSRSGGWVNSTKHAFERLSVVVSDALARNELSLSFSGS